MAEMFGGTFLVKMFHAHNIIYGTIATNLLCRRTTKVSLLLCKVQASLKLIYF